MDYLSSLAISQDDTTINSTVQSTRQDLLWGKCTINLQQFVNSCKIAGTHGLAKEILDMLA